MALKTVVVDNCRVAILRVWLDDERDIPSGYDYWSKSAEEVIGLIKQGRVGFVSLDNDLGIGMDEGRTVAEFIEREYILGNIPFVDFHPHTANGPAWDAIMACKRAVYKHADYLTSLLLGEF